MQTKKDKMLEHMQAGGTLTPISALNLFKCFSLSQRMGELRFGGHQVKDRIVKGGRYKMYWMEK